MYCPLHYLIVWSFCTRFFFVCFGCFVFSLFIFQFAVLICDYELGLKVLLSSHTHIYTRLHFSEYFICNFRFAICPFFGSLLMLHFHTAVHSLIPLNHAYNLCVCATRVRVRERGKRSRREMAEEGRQQYA